MFSLHIGNKNYSSWSLRPWILLKELNIPFEEILHPFGHESFSDFSPTAKVPCLVEGKIVVWDSLAITEYIAETHHYVWPSNKVARAWARSAVAEMHSGFFALRNYCGMNVGLRLKLHEWPTQLLADIERLQTLWSEGLEKFGGPFLAGSEFTAVDAFFAPVVFRVQTYGIKLGELEKRYCAQMLGLDSMKLWEQAALKEVWRDESHEQEVLSFASIVDDLRC